MNKALLIGGFGNIGLAVTKEFLKENFDVTVVTSQERTVNPVSGVRVIVANRRPSEKRLTEVVLIMSWILPALQKMMPNRIMKCFRI